MNVVPDLSSYDFIIANTSGGKDSQTMIRVLCKHADDQGVDRRKIVAVHADLKRAEWKGTKELAEAQARHYGLEFRVVSRRQGDLIDHMEDRAKRGKRPFPGYSTRWCTSEHKTAQVKRVMTALVQESGITGRKVRILNCLGNRAQESDKRAKDVPFEYNTLASNKTRRDVWTWAPIHEWSKAEVWADILSSGVPYHFAYDLGMPRLSCCFCIYSQKDALMLAAQHNPELAESIVAIETSSGFRWQEKMSMAEVVRDAATTKIETVADWAA